VLLSGGGANLISKEDWNCEGRTIFGGDLDNVYGQFGIQKDNV